MWPECRRLGSVRHHRFQTAGHFLHLAAAAAVSWGLDGAGLVRTRHFGRVSRRSEIELATPWTSLARPGADPPDRMVYYAFNLLFLDGFDIRAAPLANRPGLRRST